jgi:hypothetical protein
MEEENLDYKTVFTIKHSDIPKGVTQCQKHSWVKRNDNEIECTKCPTVLIVNPETLNDYLK